MGLDQRGDIAIAEVVFYVPIAIAALLLTLRHGFGRQAGWVFLLSFSIVRIVGGALHIAAEEVTPRKTGLFIAAFAIESAGVAPLLLCTSSWLQIIAARVRSNNPLIYPQTFRLARVVLTLGFVLAIIGATKADDSSASSRSTAATLRKAGGVIILASFIYLAFVHVLLWAYKNRFLTRHRTLLLGVSSALPFLLVRCIYTILSAFSPLSTSALGVSSGSLPSTSHNSLSKFNSISGSWQIFLVMSLVMEYIVVLIYLSVGIAIPLDRNPVEEEKEFDDGDFQPNGPSSGRQPPMSYGRPAGTNQQAGMYSA